jgi:hypothetical protein
MNKKSNILAGAEIHEGGGYQEATLEQYEAMLRSRNPTLHPRVRELMVEAGYAAPELADRAQKLADLLIRECADVVSDIIADYDGGSYTVSAAEEIREYFGITR